MTSRRRSKETPSIGESSFSAFRFTAEAHTSRLLQRNARHQINTAIRCGSPRVLARLWPRNSAKPRRSGDLFCFGGGFLVRWLLCHAGRDQWFAVAAQCRSNQIAVHRSDELDGDLLRAHRCPLTMLV